MVEVAGVAVVAEPGEDLGQILGFEAVQPAAVDQLAEDQTIVVKDVGQHVRLGGRVAAVEVAEAVEHVTDTPDHPADPKLLSVHLPGEDLFQGSALGFQLLDPDQVIPVLLAARAGVAGMCLAGLVEGGRLIGCLGDGHLRAAELLGQPDRFQSPVFSGEGVQVRQVKGVELASDRG